jgi:hypothetical protein
LAEESSRADSQVGVAPVSHYFDLVLRQVKIGPASMTPQQVTTRDRVAIAWCTVSAPRRFDATSLDRARPAAPPAS